MWRNVLNWTLPYRYYRNKSPIKQMPINKFIANMTLVAIATIGDSYDDTGYF